MKHQFETETSLVVDQEEKNEIFERLSQSSILIKECKYHLMRSFCQNAIKLKIMDELQDGEALLICDWAMKFIPLYYREKMTQWYGKKGISWHVSVVIFRNNNERKTLTNYLRTLSSFI